MYSKIRQKLGMLLLTAGHRLTVTPPAKPEVANPKLQSDIIIATTAAPPIVERFAERQRIRMANSLNDKARVIFLGDSLADRWRSLGEDVFVYANSNDRVQNTLWMIEHARDEIKQHPFETVAILVGANDITARVSLKAIPIGVKNLIKAARKNWPKAKIVLCLMPPRHDREILDHRRGIVNGRYRKITGVSFFEMDDILRQSDAYFADPLHISEEGYEALRPSMRRALFPTELFLAVNNSVAEKSDGTG